MNKRNQVLVAVLVLQLLAVAFALWPRSAATGGGQSLFADVTADKIVKVTVTDAEGKSLDLAKVDGSWVLPASDNYPTRDSVVPDLLAKIVALKTDRLVTQTAASHKRLKVAGDAFERRLDLELDGGVRHTLYLGTSPSYGATHVRADDQAEVYLAADVTTYDLGTQPSDWVDTAFFSVPSDQLTAIMLENAQGRFELVKEGEAWTLKGLAATETLDQTKVNSLVSRVTSVTMLRPLGKEEKAEYGLQTPAAVVTAQTHSDTADKTYVLRIGAQDATDKSYVVASSESPYFVRVSEYAAKDLVQKDRDGFLQLPPTPTATP